MKQTKTVCVIGHFGFGENLLNGQTVKTKILAEELIRRYGENEVETVDTHGGIKALLKLPLVTFQALRRCRNIVMLPAHNGVKIITPILRFWNFFFRRRLHYAVIGGWLPSMLQQRKFLRAQLKRFSGVYVETQTMEKALRNLGFSNIVVLPNCKPLEILSSDALPGAVEEPYRLVTFSRVMRQKGIDTAVNAVKEINAKAGRTVYTLDIYGQVDENETEWFDGLCRDFPSSIRYGGLVPFTESGRVLKGAFALLFPTRFYTEGIPGTIIDAYAAGVPVISSRWESFSDIVTDGITGIGYDFSEENGLLRVLKAQRENPQTLIDMRENCLRAAERYLPENVISALTENF